MNLKEYSEAEQKKQHCKGLKRLAEEKIKESEKSEQKESLKTEVKECNDISKYFLLDVQISDDNIVKIDHLEIWEEKFWELREIGLSCNSSYSKGYLGDKVLRTEDFELDEDHSIKWYVEDKVVVYNRLVYLQNISIEDYKDDLKCEIEFMYREYYAKVNI